MNTVLQTNASRSRKILAGLVLASTCLVSAPVCLGADALPAGSGAVQAAPVRGVGDYSQVLPADTAAVLVVKNGLKMANLDENTPMARLMKHPAVQAQLGKIWPDKLVEQGKLEESFGLTAQDLPRLFSGKLVAAVTVKRKVKKADLPVAKPAAPAAPAAEGEAENEGEEAPAGVNAAAKIEIEDSEFEGEAVGLVEFLGSAADYARLVEKFHAEVKRKTPEAAIVQEQVEGLTVYAVETGKEEEGEAEKDKTVYHALVDGTIVFSTSKEMLLDTARSLRRGIGAEPLSGNPEFIAVKEEMADNDGYFMVNLSAITKEARPSMLQGLQDAIAQNPQMAALFDAENVLSTLALENFSTMYGSLKMEGNRADIRYGLTWKERVGLASLINFGKEPVRIPPFVSADCKGMTVSTLDIPGSWDAISTLGQKLTPQGWGMVTMMVAANEEVSKKLKTLRAGLLDNLEPEMISLTGYATAAPADDEEPGKILLFKIKDPAAAEAAIDLALNFKAKDDDPNAKRVVPETKEYLGVKIHRLPDMPLPVQVNVAAAEGKDGGAAPAVQPQVMHPSYAILDNYLVVAVGSDGLMEGMIASMKNPGQSLAADARIGDLANLPGTPCTVFYGDLATHLKVAINESLRSGANGKAGLSKEDLLEARASCKDLKAYWAGKCYYNDKGVYVRLVIADDKQPEAAK